MGQSFTALLKKYHNHFEGKSVFDEINLDGAIKDVLAEPYTGTFVYRELRPTMDNSIMWYI